MVGREVSSADRRFHPPPNWDYVRRHKHLEILVEEHQTGKNRRFAAFPMQEALIGVSFSV